MRFNLNQLLGRLRLVRAFCPILIDQKSDIRDFLDDLLVDGIAHQVLATF